MAKWSSLPAFLPARWTVLGGFGFCFLLSAFVFLGYNQNYSGAQPIAFNHAKHLANGMACTDCHAGVETQARATLPPLEFCMTCHAAALTKTAEERKLRELAAAGGELAWARVTRAPAHVYFSHRRHVVLAKLACAICHGPMERAVVPPARPFRKFTMDACIECHKTKGGGTDCNDCHR